MIAVMHNTARATSPPAASHFPWFAVEAGVFFVTGALYVLHRIEPAISLHGSGPTFLYGAAFRSPFLARPGGWVEYAAAFLGRCDAVPLLGSVIQASLALAVVILTRGVWRNMAADRLGAAAFVPGFLVLLLRQNWGYQIHAVSLALALGLGAFLGHSLASRLPAGLRIVLGWIIAGFLFLVAGPVPVLIYVCLAAWLEGVTRKNWSLGLTFFAPVVIPFAWSFLGPEPGYWKAWLPNAGLSRGLMITLVGWPMLIPLLLFWLTKPAVPASTDARSASRKSKPPPRSWQQRLEPVTALIIFAAGLSALWLLFDEPRQIRGQIDFYSTHGEHRRVIALAQILKPGKLDSPSQLRLQRALFHAGLLGSDLFRFPVFEDTELLPGLSGDIRECRPQAETLFELGLINDAEHFAHEALESEGERPELFRLLARINYLKNRPAAARVFLNRLALIPFEAQWANECLSHLETKGTLPDTLGLEEVRSRLLNRDIAHESLLAEPLLLSLLNSNSSNRMACDFLMTHYLLRRDLKKFAGLAPRLEEFGCQQIPTHYEEALCIYQAMANEEVKFQRLKIRDNTRMRFEQFSRLLDQEMQLKRNPLPALAGDFGRTYWFYCASRQSPDAVAPN
jgi:hypothetical protein